MRERGLLEQQADGSLTLDPWLSFLAETAARAPRVLVLSTSLLSGEERRRIVHIGEGLIVEQEDLEPGRLSLTNVPDMDVLGERLLAHVGVPERPARARATLSNTGGRDGKGAPTGPDARALHRDISSSRPAAETAASLTMALRDDGEWGSASVMLREKADESDAVRVTLESTQAWLSGAGGSWLVRSTGEQGEFLQLIPASHAQILKRIGEMLAGG